MTILEASLSLIEWFRENSTYTHSLSKKTEDSRKLFPVSEDPIITPHSVHLALQDMIEAKMLKSSKLNDEETLYVLVRPLATMSQNVEISFETAAYLASIINNFNQSIGTSEIIDPTRLSEQDVKMAAELIEFLTTEDGEPEVELITGEDNIKPNLDGSMPIQKMPIKPKKNKPENGESTDHSNN